MGILQKRCRTTAKKALAYRGKAGQNTDTAFLALRLGVVLYLPNQPPRRQNDCLKMCPKIVYMSGSAWFLRIGNGVGKQGYGNRPPIDDRNPIRKFSIDCLDASKTNE